MYPPSPSAFPTEPTRRVALDASAATDTETVSTPKEAACLGPLLPLFYHAAAARRCLHSSHG